eukprot:IDg10327t1
MHHSLDELSMLMNVVTEVSAIYLVRVKCVFLGSIRTSQRIAANAARCPSTLAPPPTLLVQILSQNSSQQTSTFCKAKPLHLVLTALRLHGRRELIYERAALKKENSSGLDEQVTLQRTLKCAAVRIAKLRCSFIKKFQKGNQNICNRATNALPTVAVNMAIVWLWMYCT